MPLSSSEKPLQHPDTNPDPANDTEVNDLGSTSVLPQSSSDDIFFLSAIVKQLQRIKGWKWGPALASVGLHAGILLVPLGEEAKPPPSPPKPTDNQVRISQIPKLNQPSGTKPAQKLVVRQAAPRVNRPQVKTPAAPTLQIPPKPRPTPSPVEQTTQNPTPTDLSSKSPQATSPQTEQSPEDSPWADFPLYPGSTPGCFELQSCLEADANLSQVAAHFAEQLPAKKYETKRVVQEAGRQVHQVTRSKLSQFLSIIANGKKTVYVLSDAPRTLADLEKAVEVPPEVYAILVGLAVQKTDASAFVQSDQFYVKADEKGLNAGGLVPRSGIRNISLVPGQAADTMMDEFLRSNLQNNDFEVTDIPKLYGGGRVYQAKKGNQTLYINLVPTKDNSGTLLVIWKTPPG